MSGTVDFNEITYEYMKEDYPCNKYELFGNRGLVTRNPVYRSQNEYREWKEACARFRTAKDDLQKDFKDIWRLFGVEFFERDFQIGNKYQFPKESLEFITEILRRYRTRLIWKKEIKNVATYEANRFIILYDESEYKNEIAKEVIFAVEGLINIYKGQCKDEYKLKEFEYTIHISTQYPLLKWRYEMKEDIDASYPLNPKAVEESVAGVLQEDYCKWLQKFRQNFHKLAENMLLEWFEILFERKDEYQKMLERSSEAIDVFVAEIQAEIDKRFESEIQEIKECRPNQRAVRERINNTKRASIVREEIRAAAKRNPELAAEAYKRLIPKELEV